MERQQKSKDTIRNVAITERLLEDVQYASKAADISDVVVLEHLLKRHSRSPQRRPASYFECGGPLV